MGLTLFSKGRQEDESFSREAQGNDGPFGPISPDELGVTLVHEHFAFGFPGWHADETIAPYDREAIESNSLKILNDIKAVGVKSIVDATPCDVGGRDAVMMKYLSGNPGQYYCLHRALL